MNKLSHLFRLKYVPYFLAAFYILALFPSRIYRDSTEMFELMRQGKSTDQWTATYFRFCQFLSVNGQFPYVVSIVGIILLLFGTQYFLRSLNINQSIQNLSFVLITASPFFGVFGMTITHEVFYVSGSLFLIGFLIRDFKPTDFFSWIQVIGAFLLCSMDFIGFIAILFFLIMQLKYWPKIIIYFLICGTIVGPLITSEVLKVNNNSSGVRLGSFLGDMKCVAQQSDSNLSEADWRYFQALGPLDKWKTPLSCANSDNAGFAWNSIQGQELQFLKFWLLVSLKNPQIVLEARFQRASVALPPPLFSSQPNMISKNYLAPVGLDTQDDLEQWPGLFKTSNDDAFQSKFQLPRIFKPLEFIAIFPAFIVNRNSEVWGWGGLWLSLFIVIQIFPMTRIILRNSRKVLLFLCSVPLGLIALSPVASPRYSWLLTYFGFIYTVSVLIRLYKVTTAEIRRGDRI